MGTSDRPLSGQASAAELGRIDRPLALVAQVEQALRQAIHSGWFPDGRLPTEVELAERLGVSRETVRRAAETLQREGLLVKYRRRGTFIRAPDSPLKLEPAASTLIGYVQADYGSGAGETEAVTRAISSYLLDGALTEAGRAGFELVVRSAAPAGMREGVDQLNRAFRLRGVLFASVAEEKLLRRLGSLGLPTVLVDHDLHLPQVSSVRGDSLQSAALAVGHLATLGHRRIACVHWHQQDLNPWWLRGYRQGLRDQGLPRRRSWELLVELTRAGAAQALDDLLQLRPQPTAVICFHNTLARYVIEEARQRGLGVPGQLSVVGGGGEEILGLTCCQLDWHEMGRLAMQTLLDAIHAPQPLPPQHHLLPYALRPGTTTAPAA